MKYLIISSIVITLLSGCKSKDVFIINPDNFNGTLLIIEDKNKYDNYYGPAFENFNTYEYWVGNDKELRVKNISIFDNLEDVSFGYESVSPVYKNIKFIEISD